MASHLASLWRWDFSIFFAWPQVCDFTKLKSGTFLRVVYMGVTRIRSCKACCKRWYFTFNSNECSKPAPIDGIVYHSVDINIHRSTNIEGYCGGIPAEKTQVGFNVGDCTRSGASIGGEASWRVGIKPSGSSLKKWSRPLLKMDKIRIFLLV